MSQEIEIEFKNMLTKDEFSKLKAAFDIDDSDFILQENHYFDTPQFHLKEVGAALRIRQKQDTLYLTLKEPAQIGLLETHQQIDEKTAQIIIETGQLPEGKIIKQIENLGVNHHDIVYFGSLTTIRAEKIYREGLIVLDYSRYLNIEDYELEFEVKDEQIGKEHFTDLLKTYAIPVRTTKNKIRRFYEQKYKEMR
ncbi:CYTH domain-containing protein [Metabacillus malikii]|uniref:Uncharacterized protein YjbK n=1 Tax=Metabacillus malikii TaxID=1504265 RepID=A0ABT9ZED0_9BACI|nr:CYTH domain-containing protein [Metabacillus malikii]MDQ0230621.1 uncharacterized protein YjbK [Metabacillus malikii]